MKISGINKTNVVSASLFLMAMGIIGLNRDSKMQKQISKYKTEVLDKDSIKYASTSDSAQGKPIQVQAEIWGNAYKEVQDSVNMAARAAHRSYVIGIQKARGNSHKDNIN